MRLQKNHFLSIVLAGTGKNTLAIGSRIKVYAGKQIFFKRSNAPGVFSLLWITNRFSVLGQLLQ